MNKKKILVVDDERDIVTTVKYMLEEESYEVYTAYDGKEALAVVKRERPDAVILDLKLPGLPGEEVCRRIRKDEEISSTPIIMVTAKDLDVDRVVGRVIGANYYITKPFEMEDLLFKIKECLYKNTTD